MLDRPAACWRASTSRSSLLDFADGPTVTYVSSSDSRTTALEFRLECARGTLLYRAPRLGAEGRAVPLTKAGEQEMPLDSSLDNKEPAG